MKHRAKDFGYHLPLLFGARRIRTKFTQELVMANVALEIHAVHVVFEPDDVKPILDSFISIANELVFAALKKEDSNFASRYEDRMTDYLKILFGPKPALGMSLAFRLNCGLEPLDELKTQLLIAAHLGANLTQLLELLRLVELDAGT